MIYAGNQVSDENGASLPKFLGRKKRKNKYGNSDSVYNIQVWQPGQKSVAEVMGWRSHSLGQEFEDKSTAGAAWNPHDGLDVEKIYDDMRSDESPDRLSEPSI